MFQSRPIFQSGQEKSLEYPALIALKLGIDSDGFSNCIFKAWKSKKSEYKGLIVSCRDKKEETANFLFVYGDKVLAQLHLSTKLLQSKDYFKYRLEGAMRRVGSVRHFPVNLG